VGGLGAVLLAVHPSYGAETLQRSTVALAKVSSPTPESTTKSSTPKPKAKAKSKAKLTSKPKPPAVKKVSGIFTGEAVDIAYGLVQVQITLLDGKITDAQALEAPLGRSYRYSEYAIPILRDQTLAAQGLNIDGATGASYTSYGWYTSLQSALSRAGL
jgi:uncharacterized protein with FMN-binding domain